MNKKRYLPFLLLLTVLPVQASVDELYKQLAATSFMQKDFIAERTSTGLDFNSKRKINMGGKKHSKFHIEIEGPLPLKNVNSLKEAIETIAEAISIEVDRSHSEENPIYPGLGVDLVDINGVDVAFLQYKNSREPNTFCRRALIFASSQLYIATMSLHEVPENDPVGMNLPMLMVQIINSKEIDGLRP